MNLTRNEASRASIEFTDGVSLEFQTAIEHALASVGATDHVVVADGHAGVDEKRAHDALLAGHSFVILHAKAGQLTKVLPGTGITVPEDAALFAVKRREIPGHPNRFHTTVTVVPHADAMSVTKGKAGKEGRAEQKKVSSPAAQIESIADTIAWHVAQPSQLDSGLYPPNKANFGVVTQNCSQSYDDLYIWDWTNGNGDSQTASVRTTQNYYIYYANGAGQPPYYVILLDQNGTAAPGSGGAQGLATYQDGVKAFGLGTTVLSSTILIGSLSLAQLSPGASTSSPVETTIDYPITVMADNGHGGTVSTPFTIYKDVYNPNDKWGVTQTGNQAANEAAWEYYENSAWDALTQTPDSFFYWSGQMYSGDFNSGSVVGFDAQCINGVNYETMALWTIPANPGNQGPLDCQLAFNQSILVEGFANPDATGNGHHQIEWWTCASSWSFDVWDLVTITGSKQG
ncbi:hypothetical protein [Burkholderia ubonensis]|uniref:Uncharacterized protein n=1 Tax=Burkholderia ubonensis TaxID=101571 RepID=A0AAW3NCG1_9BURK|nr:hypothetical protein [Burkholderia ubonensis]KVT57079.1 hypothetical protein WK53_29995 [Burkholderia ubonensis]